MEEADRESKTEEPTDKKVKDAVEKGKIPVSRDVATAILIGSFCLIFIFSAEEITISIAKILSHATEVSIGPNELSNSDLVALLLNVGIFVARITAMLFTTLLITAIVSALLQNEPQIILSRIAPQVSRISISSGLARLFSLKALVEFLKSLSKLLAATLIILFALKSTLKEMLATAFQTSTEALLTISGITTKLLIWMTGMTALVALADFFWQRHDWWSDLKMSRQELKDEFKQAEGDPVVKARIRSLGRDRARSRMIQAVPTATLIVANPTHFAVALRYDRKTDPAPVVIAKGMDLVALRIRDIAEINAIPVFEKIDLARALYKSVSVDQVIPKQFYMALAELIRAIDEKRIN